MGTSIDRYSTRNDRKGLTAIAGSVLCSILTLFVGIGNGAAAGYRERTESTIVQFARSADLLDAGKLQDAQAALADVASFVKDIRAESRTLRDLANKRHDACMVRVAELELRIGDIYQKEGELKRELADLGGELQKTTTDEKLTKDEILALRKNIAQVDASLRARQAKMNELRKWFWVPGYGQYLAVRTLVDNDIGQYNSLLHTLRDKEQLMIHDQQALQHASALMGELLKKQQEVEQAYKSLSEMREQQRNRLTSIKAMVVSLTTSEMFWGKMESMLSITIQGQENDLKVLYGALDQDINSLQLFKDEASSSVKTLKTALLEFAECLDRDKSSELLKESASVCGE